MLPNLSTFIEGPPSMQCNFMIAQYISFMSSHFSNTNCMNDDAVGVETTILSLIYDFHSRFSLNLIQQHYCRCWVLVTLLYWAVFPYFCAALLLSDLLAIMIGL